LVIYRKRGNFPLLGAPMGDIPPVIIWVAAGVFGGLIVLFVRQVLDATLGKDGRALFLVLSIVVAALVTAIFALSIPPPATNSPPPVSTREFRLVFGREPPSGVEIIDSESSLDGGATWAAVRFHVGIEDLEDLVSAWTPGSVSSDKLPDENWSRDDCEDERAYLNRPDWRRREYSAVHYCADDDRAEAFYRKRD
jgi:hypothetical protein